jgi:LysR family transcriptional regulator, transcription activator of glutamate synthase operon
MVMDMETDALRWFQHVADGVTLTEVADLFQVSQPGVSRALSRLEVDVGTPLLTKNGRILRPTHAGYVFKRHVDALLHQLDDGLAAVNELVEPETGTVTLGFSPSFGAWLVPRLVSEFRLEHPQVQFRLEASDDAAEMSPLMRGTVDLQITADRLSDPSVHWERLFTQPFLLAVPPGHRLAGRSQVSLAEAAEEEFVMLRPSWGLRRVTDEICRAAGFTPRVAFEGHDLQVVRGLVAAGLGVAVIPSPSIDPPPARRQPEHLLRLTDEGASREVGLAWSRNRRLLPSAELFRQHAVTRSRTRVGAPGAL